MTAPYLDDYATATNARLAALDSRATAFDIAITAARAALATATAARDAAVASGTAKDSTIAAANVQIAALNTRIATLAAQATQATPSAGAIEISARLPQGEIVFVPMPPDTTGGWTLSAAQALPAEVAIVDNVYVRGAGDLTLGTRRTAYGKWSKTGETDRILPGLVFVDGGVADPWAPYANDVLRPGAWDMADYLPVGGDGNYPVIVPTGADHIDIILRVKPNGRTQKKHFQTQNGDGVTTGAFQGSDYEAVAGISTWWPERTLQRVRVPLHFRSAGRTLKVNLLDSILDGRAVGNLSFVPIGDIPQIILTITSSDTGPYTIFPAFDAAQDAPTVLPDWLAGRQPTFSLHPSLDDIVPTTPGRPTGGKAPGNVGGPVLCSQDIRAQIGNKELAIYGDPRIDPGIDDVLSVTAEGYLRIATIKAPITYTDDSGNHIPYSYATASICSKQAYEYSYGTWMQEVALNTNGATCPAGWTMGVSRYPVGPVGTGDAYSCLKESDAFEAGLAGHAYAFQCSSHVVQNTDPTRDAGGGYSANSYAQFGGYSGAVAVFPAFQQIYFQRTAPTKDSDGNVVDPGWEFCAISYDRGATITITDIKRYTGPGPANNTGRHFLIMGQAGGGIALPGSTVAVMTTFDWSNACAIWKRSDVYQTPAERAADGNTVVALKTYPPALGNAPPAKVASASALDWTPTVYDGDGARTFSIATAGNVAGLTIDAATGKLHYPAKGSVGSFSGVSIRVRDASYNVVIPIADIVAPAAFGTVDFKTAGTFASLGFDVANGDGFMSNGGGTARNTGGGIPTFDNLTTSHTIEVGLDVRAAGLVYGWGASGFGMVGGNENTLVLYDATDGFHELGRVDVQSVGRRVGVEYRAGAVVLKVDGVQILTATSSIKDGTRAGLRSDGGTLSDPALYGPLSYTSL